jgi:hypothetical protein
VVELDPRPDEQRLLDFVKDGEDAVLPGAAIRATLLRRLILGLPLKAGQPPPALSPVGVRLVGATVQGRLRLDNARSGEGQALPSLEFVDCTLQGGFSAARALLSRVKFEECRFAAEPLADGPDAEPDAAAADASSCPLPTVDLTGASIASNLDMRRNRPMEAPGEPGLLWIRATGARISGNVDLSYSTLRAPEDDRARAMTDPAPDALSLSLAQVSGDFWFVHGIAEGRISGRAMRIGGSVWLSGARLSRRGKETRSLFLQAATIDGVLMLNGRHEKMDRSGEYRPFVSAGNLDLLAIRVGTDIVFGDVELTAANRTCLVLKGARIGGSLRIEAERLTSSHLRGDVLCDGMHAGDSVIIADAEFGRAPASGDAGSRIMLSRITTGRVMLRSLRPLRDTLEPAAIEPPASLVSLNLDGAALTKLEVEGCRLTGDLKASPLRCSENVVLDAQVGGKVDLEGCEVGGCLDISELKIDGQDGRLKLKDGRIGRALRLTRALEPRKDRRPTLEQARTTRLRSLPGTVLIETLWRYPAAAGDRFRQIAFLDRRGFIQPLSRQTDALESFIASYGHGVDSRARAAEFLRLWCAYGRTERSARWVLAGDDPREVLKDWRLEEAAPDPEELDRDLRTRRRAPGAAQAPPAPTLAGLGRTPFQVTAGEGRVEPAVRHFRVRACLLLDGRLVVATTDVAACSDRVTVSGFSNPVPGPQVRPVPVSDGLFTDHAAEDSARSAWVTPPVLDRSEAVQGEGRIKDLGRRLRPFLRSGFSLQGTADLSGLTCDTLEDEGGRLWGRRASIKMNRFVYRQATWEAEGGRTRKPTLRRMQDWLRRLMAENMWPRTLGADWQWAQRRRWFEFARRLRDRTDYWAMWQDRRNWLYQQFDGTVDLPSRARHPVDEDEYSPQAFEQAIQVAYAEGRDDVATEFEMLKRCIEWRLFNNHVRWPLAVLGIILASVWLIRESEDADGAILVALFATLVLMAVASLMHGTVGRLVAWRPLRRALTEFLFYVPAIILFFYGNWDDHPYPFLIAFLIYMAIRMVSVVTHAIMRFGFGYLRRPVRAIGTLIVAFLVGWWGVSLANSRHMLVIDAVPVAGLAGPDRGAEWPYEPPPGTPRGTQPTLMGSPRTQIPAGEGFGRELSCAPELSEPLYALDTLIPLVDLREEERCGVRRLALEVPAPGEADAAGGEGRPAPARKDLKHMGWSELWAELPALTVDYHRFWWWMKALYAIAGWFIVSLALLTFAQVNRTRGEVAEE